MSPAPPPALLLRQSCGCLARVSEPRACGADDEESEKGDVHWRAAAEDHDGAEEPAGDEAGEVDGVQRKSEKGQNRVECKPRPRDRRMKHRADERMDADRRQHRGRRCGNSDVVIKTERQGFDERRHEHCRDDRIRRRTTEESRDSVRGRAADQDECDEAAPALVAVPMCQLKMRISAQTAAG